jgi:hypothetical protein
LILQAENLEQALTTQRLCTALIGPTHRLKKTLRRHHPHLLTGTKTHKYEFMNRQKNVGANNGGSKPILYSIIQGQVTDAYKTKLVNNLVDWRKRDDFTTSISKS